MRYQNEHINMARLIKYNQYDDEQGEYHFSYDFTAPEFKTVRSSNHLDTLTDRGKLSDMCRIMHEVHEKLYTDNHRKMSNIQIFSANHIDDMIREGGYIFSCWVHALYLTECFLALGIPARMVRCLSGRILDKECHCVTVAYCEEYHKNVLFDVANNCIYYSKKGIPMDLQEFRDCIIENKRFYYVQQKQEEKSKLVKYWLKNLIIFQSFETQRYGNELDRSNNRIINLVPVNIRLHKNYWANLKGIPVIITHNSSEYWSI